MVKLQRQAALDHFNDYARMDRWGRLYAAIDHPANFSFLVRKQRVLELLGDLTGKRVLDIGCGTGVFFPDLLELGGTVVGADGAQEMARTAWTKSADLDRERLSVLASTIEQLGLRAHAFDAVTCVGVIEYVEDEDEAIREVIRATMPGGMIIVTVPNAACLDLWMKAVLAPFRWLARRALSVIGRPPSSGTDVDRRYYTPGRLDRLMERHGCTIVDRVFYFVDLACYPIRLLAPALSLACLRRLEPHHRTPGLRWLARGYIVKARVP